ncbi:hypothetical protein [Bacillus suaedae]|uniref:Uncharacterized protein n=1 Tax=Halalkalibacter suaedae TaxID=2822140 RepID=A0A940WWH2_9BACI|nr:hypothetical protein [Bacillus suaedae]MBP3951872.1 hypothetical protein [Bacillus suaedae]
MNQFLKYFIWTVIIGFVMYIGIRFQLNLEEKAETTYTLIPTTLFQVLFPIILGLLLRLPLLLDEINKKKRWTVNWAKIIVIGIPSLYIALTPLLYFTSFGNYLPLTLEMVMLESNTVTTVAGLIFGYLLLDSLKE